MAASPADPSLQGRVCIVTGAAHGLGRAMAQALLDAGALVVAMDVAEPEADAARNGGRLLNIRADVSSSADCKGVVDRTLQQFGAVHVLVNNAGVGTRAINPDYDLKPLRFWELSPEGWDRIVAVNLVGAFNMAHAATPRMVAAGFGRIVNISTGPETMVRYGDSPYGPSKAGLESCTAIWARELAETGVTCNALAPGGPVDTALARGNIPGRRKTAFLQADIMAAPILWLASDRSARWTGRRFVARNWDPALPPEQAASRAASPARELPAIL